MPKMTLKAARVNAGYSQKQVATLLKISNRTVCAWENGKSVPNLKRVAELCALYNVAYDDVNFLPNGSPLANVSESEANYGNIPKSSL